MITHQSPEFYWVGCFARPIGDVVYNPLFWEEAAALYQAQGLFA